MALLKFKMSAKLIKNKPVTKHKQEFGEFNGNEDPIKTV